MRGAQQHQMTQTCPKQHCQMLGDRTAIRGADEQVYQAHAEAIDQQQQGARLVAAGNTRTAPGTGGVRAAKPVHA